MATQSDPPTLQQGFDFTHHAGLVCADMVARLTELAHVDLSRVAISFAQTRGRQVHGLQATLTPMRFEGGATTTRRRGRQYGVERLLDAAGREMLYILSFYLPRFLNLSTEEKVSTILHELWHIGPLFDGDLRRFQGRCYAHGHSQARYDEHVHHLAKKWWALAPHPEAYLILRHKFTELQHRYGRVTGVKIRQPKLIALTRF